jgi:hypothetical protein
MKKKWTTKKKTTGKDGGWSKSKPDSQTLKDRHKKNQQFWKSRITVSVVLVLFL